MRPRPFVLARWLERKLSGLSWVYDELSRVTGHRSPAEVVALAFIGVVETTPSKPSLVASADTLSSHWRW